MVKASDSKTSSQHTQTDARSFSSKDAEQTPFFVQKKARGGAHDPYEREADGVANQVVQSMAVQRAAISDVPGNNVQSKEEKEEKEPLHTPVQRKEEPEQKEPVSAPVQRIDNGIGAEKPGIREQESTVQRKAIFESKAQEGEESVQRKPEDADSEHAPLGDQLEQRQGHGAPLDNRTRAHMEGAIGADFSNVRIHTDHAAQQMSSGIQAQAFTHGNNIYFNQNRYNPGTGSGMHLLAHELTHTVQQGASPRTERGNATGAGSGAAGGAGNVAQTGAAGAASGMSNVAQAGAAGGSAASGASNVAQAGAAGGSAASGTSNVAQAGAAGGGGAASGMSNLAQVGAAGAGTGAASGMSNLAQAGAAGGSAASGTSNLAQAGAAGASGGAAGGASNTAQTSAAGGANSPAQAGTAAPDAISGASPAAGGAPTTAAGQGAGAPPATTTGSGGAGNQPGALTQATGGAGGQQGALTRAMSGFMPSQNAATTDNGHSAAEEPMRAVAPLYKGRLYQSFGRQLQRASQEDTNHQQRIHALFARYRTRVHDSFFMSRMAQMGLMATRQTAIQFHVDSQRQSLLSTMAQYYAQAANTGAGFMTGLFAQGNRVQQAVAQTATGIITTIRGLIPSGGVLGNLADRVLGFVTSTINDISAGISYVTNLVGHIIQSVVRTVTSVVTAVANTITSIVRAILNQLNEWYNSIVNYFANLRERLIAQLGAGEAQAMAELDEMERAAIQEATQAAAVTNAFLMNNLAYAIENVDQVLEFAYSNDDYPMDPGLEPFVDLIDRAADEPTFDAGVIAAMEAIIIHHDRDATEQIRNFTKDNEAQYQELEAKLEERHGGIVTSLQAFAGRFVAQLEQIASSVWTALTNAARAVYNGISNAIASVISAIRRVGTAIYNLLGRPVEAVRNVLTRVIGKVRDFINGIIDSVVSGVTSAVRSITSLLPGGGSDSGDAPVQPYAGVAPVVAPIIDLVPAAGGGGSVVVELETLALEAEPVLLEIETVVLEAELVVVEAEAIIAAAAAAAEVIVIVLIVLIILAIIALLIYLIYEAITAPKPVPLPRTRTKPKTKTRTRRKRKRRKPYKWIPGTRVKLAIQPGALDRNIKFVGGYRWEAHHSWPKFVGGLDTQSLIGVRQSIHINDLHNAIFIALKAQFPTVTRSQTQNARFIASLRTNARRRAQVRNTLIGVYGAFSTQTDPFIPPSYYLAGITQSEAAL